MAVMVAEHSWHWPRPVLLNGNRITYAAPIFHCWAENLKFCNSLNVAVQSRNLLIYIMNVQKRRRCDKVLKPAYMLTFTVVYQSQEAYLGPTINTHTRFNIQSARLNHQTPYVPRDSIAVSAARLAAVNRTAASAAADGGDYVNAVLTIMAVRLRPNGTVGGHRMFLRCLVVFWLDNAIFSMLDSNFLLDCVSFPQVS
jgi:hypothetical protein